MATSEGGPRRVTLWADSSDESRKLISNLEHKGYEVDHILSGCLSPGLDMNGISWNGYSQIVQTFL